MNTSDLEAELQELGRVPVPAEAEERTWALIVAETTEAAEAASACTPTKVYERSIA